MIFLFIYLSSKRPVTKVKWVGRRGVDCILSAENQTTKQRGVSLTQKMKSRFGGIGRKGETRKTTFKKSFCFEKRGK